MGDRVLALYHAGLRVRLWYPFRFTVLLQLRAHTRLLLPRLQRFSSPRTLSILVFLSRTKAQEDPTISLHYQSEVYGASSGRGLALRRGLSIHLRSSVVLEFHFWSAISATQKYMVIVPMSWSSIHVSGLRKGAVLKSLRARPTLRDCPEHSGFFGEMTLI